MEKSSGRGDSMRPLNRLFEGFNTGELMVRTH